MENSRGHSLQCSKFFAPATSIDALDGLIVLQKDYLTLPEDSRCGIPGFFQLPVDDKSLESPSYKLVTREMTLTGRDIVRCIVSPTSDITVVPVDLRGYGGGTVDGAQIERTKYILKSFEDNSSRIMSGYRTNVRLGLVVRSAGDLTQRFQIDGAVLLDPGLQLQSPYSSKPICFLGMDFITKYPYLLYVPRFDHYGMVDFMIARDPFASRPYSVHEQFYKTVIVYVDGHHNEDTGNIGCGIFFKSGSVFNMFSGVSKYDNAGTKHTKKLKERGILMAIIRALHLVRAFPVGRDFRGVIIRSTDPAIARLMAVTQVTMRNVFTDSKESGEDGFDPMGGGYYYPTANRDLMLYFCHTFLRAELRFKTTFEDSGNCGEAVAASLLAVAGSQMEEFCMRKQEKSLANQNPLIPETQSRETNKARSPDISPLGKDVEKSPQYVSLGIGGYFHIEQNKAHAKMDAADNAGLNTDEVIRKVKVLVLDERSLKSNGLADANKSPENNSKMVVVESHKDGQHVEGRTSTDYVVRVERAKDHTTSAMFSRDLSPERKKWEPPEPFHKIQELVVATGRDLNVKIKSIHPSIRGVEEKIYADATAMIIPVKAEGLLKYQLLEGQMAAQITHIREEGQEKRKKILKEVEARIAATAAEYFQKRKAIVGETRTRIKEIEAVASRQIKMAWLKSNTGTEGNPKMGGLRADDDRRRFKGPLIPLKYIPLSEPFSESFK